jgi:UDP-GlcNAc3NAcA epimerase
MTGQMLEKIEEVLLKEKPDWVLVYGDTNSTLAGALAASKLHIKVAHVEAGLRSFNMNMPEEVNRILTDRISTILFCPTKTAVKNLEKEGYFVEVEGRREKGKGFGKVINVGDVMYDGALFYKELAKKPSIKGEGRREKGEGENNSSTFNLQPSTFILCTIHRAENTDDPQRLKNIFQALNEIAKDTQIILPLHPRTKKLLPTTFYLHPNLTIIDPVGYLEMVWLLDNCKLVMTDSGGLQKEAYFFNKPCIILRDETEWVELVEIGANKLVGADKEKIIESYLYISNSLLEKEKTNTLITNNQSTTLYGNGKASKKIIEELLKYE